ncbi:MAG TPA: hypothetical protein VN641_06865 [Urbifossiella sp.]|nr:hypothetical protein [Urbifossiella sp.]
MPLSSCFRLLSLPCLAFGLCFLSACSSGPKDENLTLIPVTGKVFVGKKVLPTGQVTYYPDETKGNTSNKVSSGLIQPDGTYSISTGTTRGVKEGVPAGWYKVTVGKAAVSGDTSKVKVPEFNEDYASEKTTTLRIEVKAGAPAGAYDLKIN